MSKQLTKEEIFNAKRIHLYNDEVIYVEMEGSEDVYGICQGSEWFKKENFRDYFETSSILSFFRELAPQEAIDLLKIWEKEKAESDAERLNRAIIFATEKHSGQFRKGTTIPYIVHPLEVLQILYSMRAETDLLIAGVLHDTVEDTDTSLDEIRELFGENVAMLVASNSEDKSKSWKERKQHTIDELAKAPTQVKMLVMADKLSNSRSIAIDYADIGDELWKRFNASKEMQAWYYSGIQDSLFGMQALPECEQAYWELVHLFKVVFVKFYYDSQNEQIYQISDEGAGYIMKKGVEGWYKLSGKTVKEFLNGEIPQNTTEVEQRYAEKLEESWSVMYNEFVASDATTILR